MSQTEGGRNAGGPLSGCLYGIPLPALPPEGGGGEALVLFEKEGETALCRKVHPASHFGGGQVGIAEVVFDLCQPDVDG